MAELKHSKNIIREPFYKASAEFGGKTIFKHTNDDNMGVVYEHICIDDPRWVLNGTHVSETHELFCFIGAYPENIRDPFYIDYEPGWTGTSIWAHHDEYKAGISLGYHCIVTPYDVRMNHGHDFHETLAFLSGDPKNIRELGAEVTVRLGDEQESHTFNTPTIISMPPGLKHCPMLVDKVTKPVIFLEVSATKLFKGKPEDR